MNCIIMDFFPKLKKGHVLIIASSIWNMLLSKFSTKVYLNRDHTFEKYASGSSLHPNYQPGMWYWGFAW